MPSKSIHDVLVLMLCKHEKYAPERRDHGLLFPCQISRQSHANPRE